MYIHSIPLRVNLVTVSAMMNSGSPIIGIIMFCHHVVSEYFRAFHLVVAMGAGEVSSRLGCAVCIQIVFGDLPLTNVTSRISTFHIQVKPLHMCPEWDFVTKELVAKSTLILLFQFWVVMAIMVFLSENNRERSKWFTHGYPLRKLFTARIRRMGEGTVSQVWVGGYPIPGLGRGGVPHPRSR